VGVVEGREKGEQGERVSKEEEKRENDEILYSV
jgi:hypothetical protein